jgi:hypothetical protein
MLDAPLGLARASLRQNGEELFLFLRVPLGGGVGEACPNVCRFNVGVVVENFSFRSSCRQHIENVVGTNAHPANARLTTTLRGIEGDAFREGNHQGMLAGKLATDNAFSDVGIGDAQRFAHHPSCPLKKVLAVRYEIFILPFLL